MLLPLHRLDISLTLLGPILTRGTAPGQPGIDAPIARDAAGHAVLPFSLIKGKVRDAFAELLPGDERVPRWLGGASKDGSYDPQRGLLRFGDLVTRQSGAAADGVIERIALDAATGAASEQKLALLEAPFGYGEEVVFCGNVELAARPDEAEQVRAALERALRWVPAYGSMRTVGFGRTKHAEVRLSACPARRIGAPAEADRLGLRLRFDRPLCLVGRKHARNHFDCLESVPGAVLKGACARLLLDRLGLDRAALGELPAPWDVLGRNFDHIRFSEARPTTPEGVRPVEPPLSLVTVPTAEGELFDVALEAGPRLVRGAAPEFAIDWKEKVTQRVRAAFGWPDLARERRVRTAIDEVTGRAKEEMLFSYGLVVPRETVWVSEIGLDDVPAQERQDVRARLAELLEHGLPGVGKTRAVAGLGWLAAAEPPALAAREQHVVTLQTEALLTDPERLAASGPEALAAAYRDYWHEASGGALRLARYFARQALFGGYLAQRFKTRAYYEPFLVTTRGSAFVLRPTGTGDALACLHRWQRRGLPLAGWVERRYSGRAPLWQRCPFLPQVGSGEVVIDHECHTSHRP